MGGVCPLGYRPEGRTLAIVPDHAEVIRELFSRYLEIGNVRLLAEQLAAERRFVPTRSTITGRALGGGRFTRGQIYKILSNPIYLGEIHHKGRVHEGKHEAIIDRNTWDKVQATLADNQQGQQRAATARSPSLLAGLVVDEHGEPLIASHACKGKVRYRYYVSRSLQHEPDSDRQGIRMSGLELEKAISAEIAAFLDKPLVLAETAGLKPKPDEVARLGSSCRGLAEQVRKRTSAVLRRLIARVQVHSRFIAIELSKVAIAHELGVALKHDAREFVHLRINAQLKQSGKVVRLVQANGQAASGPEPQQHLVKLLRRARSMWREMCDEGLSVSQLAERHGMNKSYVSRIIRINFLCPPLVEAILAGEQPVTLDARALLGMHKLPLSWTMQKHSFNVA